MLCKCWRRNCGFVLCPYRHIILTHIDRMLSDIVLPLSVSYCTICTHMYLWYAPFSFFLIHRLFLFYLFHCVCLHVISFFLSFLHFDLIWFDFIFLVLILSSFYNLEQSRINNEVLWRMQIDKENVKYMVVVVMMMMLIYILFSLVYALTWYLCFFISLWLLFEKIDIIFYRWIKFWCTHTQYKYIWVCVSGPGNKPFLKMLISHTENL